METATYRKRMDGGIVSSEIDITCEICQRCICDGRAMQIADMVLCQNCARDPMALAKAMDKNRQARLAELDRHRAVRAVLLRQQLSLRVAQEAAHLRKGTL